MTEPPNDAAVARPRAAMVRGEPQHEPVRKVHGLDVESHAAIGKVGDEAIEWRRADRDLDSSGEADRPAMGFASFHPHGCDRCMTSAAVAKAPRPALRDRIAVPGCTPAKQTLRICRDF